MHTVSRVLFAFLLVNAACGRKKDEDVPTASPPPVVAARAPAAAAHREWPKSPCSVLAPAAVVTALGKPTTSREEVSTCVYLPEHDREISIAYYNNKNGSSEYAVFKGLQDERKTTPEVIAGLGAEALEGNSGTGAGLAVLMADGRSFMVGDGTKDQRLALARLVVAAP